MRSAQVVDTADDGPGTVMPGETPAGLPVDVPETDDPAVLRELLRQAREHLRLRESIERLMAENVARTEALLLETRATRRQPTGDPEAWREAIASARTSLQQALAAIKRLDDLAGPSSPASAPPEPVTLPPTLPAPDGTPGTIEVLVHEIHSPALARSLQRHLSDTEGVARAEVRELAEGILRITVESAAPITGETLAAWEPRRARTVRTSRADVLEIELSPAPEVS
jgi:hypothetical protein